MSAHEVDGEMRLTDSARIILVCSSVEWHTNNEYVGLGTRNITSRTGVPVRIERRRDGAIHRYTVSFNGAELVHSRKKGSCALDFIWDATRPDGATFPVRHHIEGEGDQTDALEEALRGAEIAWTYAIETVGDGLVCAERWEDRTRDQSRRRGHNSSRVWETHARCEAEWVAAGAEPCATGQLRIDRTISPCCWANEGFNSSSGQCMLRKNGELCHDAQPALLGEGCPAGPQTALPQRPPLSAGLLGTLRHVPAGTWLTQMRVYPAAERSQQLHTVDGFYMMQSEVTQAMWHEVMGNRPSFDGACGDDCPVESVSAEDIGAFIQALTLRDNQSYRLPTDIEWEWAARGGTAESFAGSADPAPVGWTAENADHLKPVCTLRPNGFGLCDMSGNVWEVTTSDIQLLERVTSPPRQVYVKNGGSWFGSAQYATVFERHRVRADDADDGMGFRLVRALRR